MVDEKEEGKISIEAEQISKELCSVFNTHLENLIKTDGELFKIIHEIVLKTLICKANRDNPNYPNPKDDDVKMSITLTATNSFEETILIQKVAEYQKEKEITMTEPCQIKTDKNELERWQERQEKNMKNYERTQKEIKEHPERFRWINGAPIRKKL